MTCFFFSTAADWADTFSAAAAWAALAAEVAPVVVAARAVQPVAAAAAAAQRGGGGGAVQPAEASAAAGRPEAVVEVARPAPEAVVAARASTRVAAAGLAAMASLRPCRRPSPVPLLHVRRRGRILDDRRPAGRARCCPFVLEIRPACRAGRRQPCVGVGSRRWRRRRRASGAGNGQRVGLRQFLTQRRGTRPHIGGRHTGRRAD